MDNVHGQAVQMALATDWAAEGHALVQSSPLPLALAGQLRLRPALGRAVQARARRLLVVADPGSGCTALIRDVIGRSEGRFIVVDTRDAATPQDLASGIADEAVRLVMPDALGSWTGIEGPYSAAGAQIRRLPAAADVPEDDLQNGDASADHSLRSAFAAVEVLGRSDSPISVVIDHLGPMVAASKPAARAAVLNALDGPVGLPLVLIDHPGGPIATRRITGDGTSVTPPAVSIRRPDPEQIADDLALLCGGACPDATLVRAVARRTGGPDSRCG